VITSGRRQTARSGFAYDADEGEYLWQRRDGAILKGPEYGPLRLYRLPNGELASIQKYFNRPLKPCACCDKDKQPSDREQCDCAGGRCPFSGCCIKHCMKLSTKLTHWHFDKDGNQIPTEEIVVRPEMETVQEMIKAGILPESLIPKDFFKEPLPERIFHAIKGFFKAKKAKKAKE
jgi:hypothetical protein